MKVNHMNNSLKFLQYFEGTIALCRIFFILRVFRFDLGEAQQAKRISKKKISMFLLCQSE